MFNFEEWRDNLSNIERLITAYILAVQGIDDMPQYLVQSSEVVRISKPHIMTEPYMVAVKNEMLVGLHPSTDGGDKGSTSVSAGISSFT